MRTWQEARPQRPLPIWCFSGRSEKQDGRSGLLIGWVIFRHLLWNYWTEFNETWQEARSQRPLPCLCFIGLIGKTRWRPWPLIVLRHFRLLLWKPLNGIQWKLTGSKISTSSTKFFFIVGLIRKTRWRPWPLIGGDIVDFFSETAERNSLKTRQEVRSQRPLLRLCFSGRSEKQDGHPGFWFAETFSTWLRIVHRCTICGPLGLLFPGMTLVTGCLCLISSRVRQKKMRYWQGLCKTFTWSTKRKCAIKVTVREYHLRLNNLQA